MKKLAYLFSFLAVLFSVHLFAQNVVSGTVLDETGNPIPGVTILISGTTQGTTSDFDGNFSLTVPANAQLEVSSIGFTTQTVSVNNQSTLSIVLIAEVSKLEEVVLTGYATQARKSITGAVAVLDVEELQNLPDQSVLNQLQGRVTGVQIGKNSGPGGVPLIRIRGYGNVSTSNNPLFVIDGVQTTSPEIFNLINPTDIESIQVLKDASSAAIYGTRANNGVVIVTTKKGSTEKGDKITFNVDISTAMQRPRTEAYPSFLSPQEYADYLWLRQTNAGNAPTHPQYGTGSSPILPNYLTPAGASTVNPSTYALVAGADNNPIKEANKQGTNWVDAIFDTNYLTNINLSAAKSTNESNFYISSAFSSNNGILKYTSFDRYSLRANSDFKVNDWLTFGESLTIAYSERKGASGSQNEGGPIMMAHRIQPIIPIYDIEGNFAGTAGGGLGNASNPLALLYRNRNDIARTLRGVGNVYATFHLTDEIDFKSSVGIDYSTTTSSDLTPVALEDQEQQTTNRFNEWNGIFAELTFSNTLIYHGVFDEHRITPLVGIEYNTRNNRVFNAFRNGFASEALDFLYLDAGPAGSQFNGGSGSRVNLFSYFSKIDYAFQDKLFLSGSVRVDQSSRYTEENRTGVFPAFGLAYRLSEEPFIQNGNFFDSLRLRLAWGQTGNSETSTAYPTSSTFGLNGTTNNYDINGSSSSALIGYASSRDGNPNLKWETAETLDFAIEMDLLDNRLNLEVGYYNKKTKDMLVRVPRPGTSGLAEDPFENIGDMSNKGVEFLIGYSGNLTNKFSFNTSLNMSFNKNEVIKLSDNDQSFIQGREFRQNPLTRTEQGQPISYFYGFKVDGFYTTQAEVDALDQSNGAIGSFRYADINNDGEIDQDDRTKIGSPHPDALFGFNLGFNYNNFDLTFFFDGTFGNDIYNFKKYFTDFHFFPGAVSTNVLNAWTPSNPNAILPLSSNSVNNQEIPNSYYVEDGSYLRMRNIQLSYDFPKEALNKIGFKSLRAFLQIDNAFIITDYTGLDPEINILNDINASDVNLNLGIDQGAYPNPRSVVVGLNIGIQ